MTSAPKHFPLSLLSLGLVLLVSACGGGDALPPGSSTVIPAAPGADTIAPVLSISSSAAGSTATGDVTFTFSFNESVGTSFSADDIVVTGGSKGLFFMKDTNTATLVVTPTPNSAGSIKVSVPALAYQDAAGNTNSTSAEFSQAYNTKPPTPGSTGNCTAAPCIGFEAAGMAMVAFGGLDASVITDPALASNKLVKLLKVAANETWAGATVDPSGTGAATVPEFAFASNKKVTLRVYSPAVGEVMMLKVENAADASVFMESQVKTTVAADWETLTFDFANPSNGSFDASKTYNRVSIFPHFGAKVAADTSYLIDELNYQTVQPSGNTGSCTSASGLQCYSFSESGMGFAPFGGALTASLASDPVASTPANDVAKFVVAAGDPGWAGATVKPASAMPALVFGSSKLVTLRVYSPAAGRVVLLKFENSANSGQNFQIAAKTTVANQWETLTFDYAALGTGDAGSFPHASGIYDAALSYNMVSIFPDFATSDPKPHGAGTYYFDELKYPVAVAPVNTGTLVFSSGFKAGNLTNEGGAYYGFSGSDLDGWNCTGGPSWCGNGGNNDGTANSNFYQYYQTSPNPASLGLYVGLAVQGPGVAALNTTGDTVGGLSISGQTKLNFNFNQNPEWAASATKNFGVKMIMGKYYNVGSASAPAACNITLLAVVTPSNSTGATAAYSIPLSSFNVIQNCGTSISTAAAALASAKVVSITFEGDGGTAALGSSPKTGANLTVPQAGVSPAVYPTTVNVSGAITFN
ncbi:hypothetical protein DBR47_12120 [Paucibacter sp. KBW04]|uniref:Ig-like domain-containing protein n=1 Tax=Paucibacter sp. KBW04 TaxID=2153361 RepID=UPI000F5735A6|nr:Ig-like domain-containing protein [Paucibacter sp. KBW04]RQO58453.1 hypothetical protein DBR47_12120 [Paucibacter sp. KBW04]